MSLVTLKVYDVTIMNSADKSFIRTTVQALNKVRAFMIALAASKWKAVCPDDVTYHCEEITYFDVEKQIVLQQLEALYKVERGLIQSPLIKRGDNMDGKTRDIIEEHLEEQKGEPEYTSHAYIEGFLDGCLALGKINIEEREELYDEYTE